MKHKLDEFYDILKLDRKNSAWSGLSTLESRHKNLFDEVQEIKLAIENNDTQNLKEELGDSLWGVLYLMMLAEEKGMFTSKEVIESSIEKMKRRKPWIFTGEKLHPDEEYRRWQEAKDKEKE